jgi:hypothetical protein
MSIACALMLAVSGTLAACGGDEPVGTSAPNSTEASSPIRVKTNQSVRGTASLAQVSDLSGYTDTTGAVVKGTSRGTAQLSHLGPSTFRREFTATRTPQHTSSIRGTAILVAADGDKLFGRLEGTSADQVVTFVMTVTGGTGRFADATGDLTWSGPATSCHSKRRR